MRVKVFLVFAVTCLVLTCLAGVAGADIAQTIAYPASTIGNMLSSYGFPDLGGSENQAANDAGGFSASDVNSIIGSLQDNNVTPDSSMVGALNTVAALNSYSPLQSSGAANLPMFSPTIGSMSLNPSGLNSMTAFGLPGTVSGLTGLDGFDTGSWLAGFM